LLRLAAFILALTAIAVGLVAIRRSYALICHETQQLRLEQIRLSRKLWDQQERLGVLTRPDSIRSRAEEMTLGLTDRDVLEVAANGQPHRPR